MSACDLSRDLLSELPYCALSGHMTIIHFFGAQGDGSDAGRLKVDYDITGEVLVGVEYKAGQLLVHVNKARGLAAADSNGLSDPYVKTYLLPDKSKHSKRKTDTKRRTLDPVYNQTLEVRSALCFYSIPNFLFHS